MELLSRKTRGGSTTIFNDAVNGSDSSAHCYSLYEDSRTFYIPLFHAVVMITGLVANLYVIVALHCLKDEKKSRKPLGDLDFLFSHLGLCNIATVLTIPAWVSQTVFVKGWVFGYMVCKVVKGLNTFCFQYGMLLLVYINVERYMKVVHNRTTFKRVANARTSTGRRFVCRLCAVLPALSALVDMCYYTVAPVSEKTVMCFNTMHPYSQIVTFWTRMNIYFILPVVVFIYCNGMLVYTVRKHARKNPCAKKMTRSQILPFLMAALFVCCWIPWIGSTVYYRWHVECLEVMHVVLNVSVAIGNMHCITSPILYIVMRTR